MSQVGLPYLVGLAPCLPCMPAGFNQRRLSLFFYFGTLHLLWDLVFTFKPKMILLQLTEQVGAPIAPADPTEEIEPQELKDLARSLPVAQFTLQVSGAWKGVKQSLSVSQRPANLCIARDLKACCRKGPFSLPHESAYQMRL